MMKRVRKMSAYPDNALRFIYRHIFISLTGFIRIPNSMRILYDSLITVSQASFKSINT
jgi:hypothetical protein